MDIIKHLLERGLDPNQHGVLLDVENCIATFLLYNLSGQIVGYQQYNPNGSKQLANDEKNRNALKYFTFIGDENNERRSGKKKLAVWGLQTVSIEHDFVFITEGIFDAVKLQNEGLPALAALANDPAPLLSFLKALSKRVIAVCDDDDAGKRLGSIANIKLVVPKPFHDLGDMSQEDVKKWLNMSFYNQ